MQTTPPFEKRIQLRCHDVFQGDLAKFIVCTNGIHMHVYTLFAIKVFTCALSSDVHLTMLQRFLIK